MKSTHGAAASGAATEKLSLSRTYMAFLIVFVFIGSAFFTAVVADATAPRVWTAVSDYDPGDAVEIFGSGFLAGGPTVKLIITQDGVNYLDDSCAADANGAFDYVSFSIPLESELPASFNSSIPFVVMAYQDADHSGSCTFFDCRPHFHHEIDICKTVSPTCAAFGFEDHVTFTITITNPNTDTSLTLVKVKDDMMGDILSHFAHVLQPGHHTTWSYDVPVTNLAATPGLPEITNMVGVWATDSRCQTVQNTACAFVDILHPGIEVQKTANPTCAAYGFEDHVTFTITITNPSTDTVMTLTKVEDDIMGNILSHFDQTLSPGHHTTWSYDVSVTDLPATPGLPEITNMVGVWAKDKQNHPVQDTSCAYVDILHPMISVLKEADKSCAAVGEYVTYEITVTNPSNDTHMTFDVYDSLLGSPTSTPIGFLYHGDLYPLQSVILTGDHHKLNVGGYVYLPALCYRVTGHEPSDPFTNRATVDAWDDQNHHVPASSTGTWSEWTVDIRHIDVQVTKWADKTCAAVGEDVIYEITVTNPTDTWLNFTLWDSQFGYLWGPGSFDKWGTPYWPLAPGESVTFGGNNASDVVPDNGYVYLPVLDHTVTASDSDPLVNHATVTVCDDQYWTSCQWWLHIKTNYSASWTVDIRHIDVQVTKWADKTCAAIGEDVIYEITVTNPTDTWLNFTLWDSQFGYLWGPGSFDKWGTPYWPLAPGESVTFGGNNASDVVPDNGYVYLPVLDHTVTANDSDPLDNYAYAWVWDDQYWTSSQDWLHEKCNASAPWTVDIRNPAISVDKYADKTCAAVGETVIYSILITNTGDCWLNFTVTDPLFGGVIWGPGFFGDRWNDPYWALAPGQWIELTGDRSQDTNPDVTIVYLSVLKYTITGIEGDPLVNTVTVFAWDDQYVPGGEYAGFHSVTQTDSWTVDIRNPAISVDKYADKTCAAVGETVIYSILITNTGDCWLNFTVTDPLFGGVIWGPGFFGDRWNDPYWALAPGQWIELTGDRSQDTNPDVTIVYLSVLNYTITGTEDDPLVNTVSVFAWDDQYVPGGEYADLHSVTQTDSWSVDIRHIDVQVTKWADKTCAAIGEDVIYEITVYNPTDTVLDFELFDSQFGYLWGPGSFDKWGTPYWPLAPGESVTFGGNNASDVVPDNGYVYLPVLDHTVTASDSDPLVNYAYVWVWDDQYWTSSQYWLHVKYNASAPWTVDIRHIDVQVTKWADKTCAAIGEDVIYEITVTNPTDTWLNFTLWDSQFGYLWGPGSFDKWGTPYWPLAPGESVTFGGNNASDVVPDNGYVYLPVLDHTVTANDSDPLINYAYVTVWDDQYWTSSQDWLHVATNYSASWTVDIRHPGIIIDKWADETCAAVGDDIHYRFYLLNTGDTNLSFELYDDLFGGFVYAGTLTPGQQILLYYIHTVTGTEDVDANGVPDDPLINTAWVNAWDDQYDLGGQWADLHFVTQTDSWTVDILHPMIDVEKSAEKTVVMVGDYINYEITVTNPSWDTWMNFTLSDSKLGNIWGPGSFDMYGTPYWPLAPGQSVTFGGNITLDTGPDGTYVYLPVLHYKTVLVDVPYTTNTVTVLAWDHQHHYVSDMDSVIVTVQLYATVTGFVYQDNDVSGGLMGAGDTGLFTWKVTLSGTDMFGHAVDRFTFSGTDGSYNFTDVVPGDNYTVMEELQPGWTNTTLTSYDFSIASGETKRFDFGNIQFGRITGVKWLDDHMNGYQDLAPWPEPGLEGWVIHCDGVTVSGDTVNRTTTTGPDGSYAFDNLPPGTYDVWEELPAGWVAITPWIYYGVEVQGGQEVTCCKFGNVKLESISGWKFYDWNMNRVKDGEPGVCGWNITLTGWLNDGTFPFWPINATPVGPITIQSGPDGSWSFDNLLPGVYIVTEESRDGWYHTTPASITFWIASYYGVSQVKFGNVPLTTIYGFKFFDKDLDGVMDAGEPGLSDWTITLEKETSPGVWTSWGSTTTDALGMYAFGNLLPGNYRVNEVVQNGWTNTSVLPILVTIPAYSVSHQLEPQCIAVNIGNIRYASIEGYKFFDEFGPGGSWPNGIRDPGESGLGEWHIVLEGRTVNGNYVWMDAWTKNTGSLSEIGYYCFGQLLPGKYWVNETVLPGWVPTKTSVNLIVVPAYPYGPPVKIVVDFANILPGDDPAMSFVLKSGWNLWSSPLDVPGLTAKSLLSAIGPTATVVSQLNKTSGRYESYVAGAPARYDFKIVHGQGYYVAVKSDAVFTLQGWYVPASGSSVKAGWNIIGYNGVEAIKASALLASVQGCSGTVLTYLDSATGIYHSYIKGAPDRYDFAVTPGVAYFIWVDGTGTV